MRKAKYDLDEAQVKPYFELNNVLQNGVFYAANQLYGITFKERQDLPVYEPTMRVFEVFNDDGSPLALFYCDYFKRDNKQGGAWMGNYVDQSKLLGTKPVVYNVANFAMPAPGEPALLTSDDVHDDVPRVRPRPARHVRQHRISQPLRHRRRRATSWSSPRSSTSTGRLPEVFQHYAKHYKTGEPMPAELVEKIKKARHLQQGLRHHRVAGGC